MPAPVTPAQESERAPAPEGPRARGRGGGAAAPAPAHAGPPPLRLVPPGGAPVVPGSFGRPLPSPIADAVERGLGVDVSAVRVHDDERANRAAAKRRVRAFAYGTDVYLGSGERPTDVGLIAHEVAHAVQQTGRPALQLFTGAPAADPLEREAQAAGAAVARGQSVTVTGRTAPREQGGLLSWIKEGLEDIAEWVEDKFWDLLEEVVPSLVPILRKGVFTWLKEKVGAALEAVVHTLMAPVRAVGGFISSVTEHFRNLLDWIREAVGKLAKGDCSAISEAAGKIKDVVEGIASPVVDKVKDVAKRIADFFGGLWDRYGKKAWEWLKSIGGAAWDAIKWFAEKLWDLTKPIRDLAGRAWRWLKEKIMGSSEGPEGSGGLLAWVQEKAEAAWDWIKEKLEPIKKPLMVVGAVIVALSPAGPIIAIGAAVGGLIYGARWIAAHLRDRGSVVRERGVLRGVIIPGIMRAVSAVSSAVTRAAGFLTGVLTRAVDGLGAAVGAIGSSIFRFLLGIVRWILEQVGRLASWALEKVTAVAEFIARGLARLAAFLQPVLDVIVAIGEVIADLLNIVKLIFARAWNLIPACIRDPIVEFIRDQILKRIPVFSQLLEIPDIWTKVKETALTIIRQIFRDGDLIGAAITFFKAVLRILSIPVELVTGIFTKAAAALGSIVRSPIRFLRSVLGAAWQGFKQFFGKILTYLLGGVLDWLTGELKEAGVVVPSEWSFVGVLKLVLSVLGVTLEKIWKLLARKIGDPLVEKLKEAIGFLTGAWEWVGAVITEGPVGLWRKLQEQIGQLKDLVVGAVAGYVSETVVGQAIGRILTALNPVGAIVNAILLAYKAIQTAARYARQILEIVNRVLDAATDLAAGAVAGAANIIEWALARVLPIAIGFLANYLGLGGFGHKVAEMVKKIQDRVEKAIESVIDWAINAGRSLLNALGLGKKDERKPGDVKDRAGALLLERVAGHHTEEQVKAIIAAVRDELRPEGLTGLYLEPPKENADRLVIAESSPGKAVAKAKAPKAPTAGTVMVVTLTVSEDALALLEREHGGPLRFEPRLVPQPGATSRGAWPGQPLTGAVESAEVGFAAPGQTRIATRLVKPAPGTRTIQTYSYNSGDPATLANTSHAEYSFWEFLNFSALLSKVVDLKISMNFSPCTRCAELLAGMKTDKFTASLTYGTAYVGRDRKTQIMKDNTTTQEDLAKLRGWQVVGPTPRWTNASKQDEIAAGISIDLQNP